jgi:2-polyprenyl-6-methoxyphenol hydroxylase-like FAD-dependent oxidoreductase
MSKNYSQRKHAIVIGGSMGGLLTARALRNHFERVTILEKDKVNHYAESRKGQPHTKHLHGLLPAGLNVMLHYFPSLLNELKEAGAIVVDFASSMHWFTHGGYRKSFEIGMPGVSSSRPMLEHIVRNNVLQMPGIELTAEAPVKQLMVTEDKKRITGVVIQQQGETVFMAADLVVDVSGRGSHTVQWLQGMNYELPPVSEVKVNVGYATRLYERDVNDPMGKKWIFNTPDAPNEYTTGGAFPIDGNRWIVTLAGWHGRHASTNEQEFEAFAKSLAIKDVYELMQKCKPVSDIVMYKYPGNVRRHYEKLKHFPAGYLVLGDAVCSFNPIYGQGMTSAALQAKKLDELLFSGISDKLLAPSFFKSISKIIDIPWKMAVGEDFRYPETIGPRPPAIRLINKYISKVHKATLKDEQVCEAFLKVMSLLKPPASLFHPKILWRVMRA